MAPNPPPGLQPPISKSAVINKGSYQLSHESSVFYSFSSCFLSNRFMNIIKLHGFTVMDLHCYTFFNPGFGVWAFAFYLSDVLRYWRVLKHVQSERFLPDLHHLSSGEVRFPHLSPDIKETFLFLSLFSPLLCFFLAQTLSPSSRSLQRNRSPSGGLRDWAKHACQIMWPERWAGTCFSWQTGLCVLACHWPAKPASSDLHLERHRARSVFACWDLAHLISVRLPIRTWLLRVWVVDQWSNAATPQPAQLNASSVRVSTQPLFFFQNHLIPLRVTTELGAYPSMHFVHRSEGGWNKS